METPQLVSESARKLLAAFGSPEATIAADAPAPRNVITLGDPRYPNSLLEAPDPPLMLYVEGRAELLAAPALAIVGSRSPTHRRAPTTRTFSPATSATAGSRSSRVWRWASTPQRTRARWKAPPARSRWSAPPQPNLSQTQSRLSKGIASNGLIVSEYSLGMPPPATNFPWRNRILAGLARGTLVVEAALQSGSLTTARMANEAGREALAIPGSINSPQSRGCHALIKPGAKLDATAQDILDELRWPGNAPPVGPDAPPDAGDPLLAALGFDPVTLDALVGRTGSSAAELSVHLLDLELGGQVARLPGQLFQRVTRG